jgi:hypothetical protein
MDRRTFSKMAGLAAIGALAELPELAAEQTGTAKPATNAWMDEVVLQDQELLVAPDLESGALNRLERKSSGWMIQRRPEFGVSFRPHAPRPDRRASFVLGAKQRVHRVEKISANQVRLQWKDLVSKHAGVLPTTFTATVTLNDGALIFDSSLDNNSPLWVGTIDYPYLGDLDAPSRDSSLTARIACYDNLQSDELYRRFVNERDCWGVDFPTETLQGKLPPR